MDIKEIGFLHCNCDLKKNGEVKGQIMFVICKYTSKVALISFGPLTPISPLVVSGTHITNGKCLDGDYCYNLDCEYCKSGSMARAIKGNPAFKEAYEENPEGVENFIKNQIEYVEENADTNWKDLKSTEYCDFMAISV